MKKIPKEQILDRIRLDNPWWEIKGAIPAIFSKMQPRTYLELLYPLVKSKEVSRAVVLMGPRRVGKTVLIYHTIQMLMDEGIDPKSICYFSVDHPIFNGLGLEEFLGHFQSISEMDYNEKPCYFFFDEIQYLKDWEKHLKVLVDRNHRSKFVVSGSAAAALKLKSQESGAGRFTDFLLPPLSFHEFISLSGKSKLIEGEEDAKGILKFSTSSIEKLNALFLQYLNFGGYPEVVFSKEIQRDPGRFIKSDIIDKVLLRDLPGLYGIQDIQELNYLFTTLAFNTANEISLEELSSSSGVAKNTIKRYIEYLEAAFLIKVVHRVDRNAKRFKRANFFKVYLTNPSIRAALFSPLQAGDTAMGSLVETAIYSQWFHSDEKLHYARWGSGEVDIVNVSSLQKARWAVEVKWSDRFYKRPGELKSLLSFCHHQNLGEASVTTIASRGSVLLENVNLEFVPASLYCYELGYNLVKGKKSSKGFLEGMDPDFEREVDRGLI